jgi:hypothetical protein
MSIFHIKLIKTVQYFFRIAQNGSSNLAEQYLAGALSEQYQGLKKEKTFKIFHITQNGAAYFTS